MLLSSSSHIRDNIKLNCLHALRVFCRHFVHSHAHLGICMACSAYSLCCNFYMYICVCVVCVVVVCLCQPLVSHVPACLAVCLSVSQSVLLTLPHSRPSSPSACLLYLLYFWCLNCILLCRQQQQKQAQQNTKKKKKTCSLSRSHHMLGMYANTAVPLTPYAGHAGSAKPTPISHIIVASSHVAVGAAALPLPSSPLLLLLLPMSLLLLRL